jgi:hypothetical protein
MRSNPSAASEACGTGDRPYLARSYVGLPWGTGLGTARGAGTKPLGTVGSDNGSVEELAQCAGLLDGAA